MAFSKRSRTPKRCKKANVFPCKGECVPRYHWKTGTEQHCRNVAAGAPSTYLEWAKQQGQRKKAINTKRKAWGETLFKTDKFGGLINPDKTKDGKLPETYRKKAEQARAIGEKSKDPKIKELAEKTAQKAETVAEKVERAEKSGAGINLSVDIDELIAQAKKRLEKAEEVERRFYKKAELVLGDDFTSKAFKSKPELDKERIAINTELFYAQKNLDKLNEQKIEQDRNKESFLWLYEKEQKARQIHISTFQGWINEGQNLLNKYLDNIGNESDAAVVDKHKQNTAYYHETRYSNKKYTQKEKGYALQKYLDSLQAFGEVRQKIISSMDNLLLHIAKQSEIIGYTPKMSKEDAMQVRIDSSVTSGITGGKHNVDELRKSIADFYLLTGGSAKINIVGYWADRAYARMRNKSVNIGSPLTSSKAVMFHELGHHLEYSVQDAAKSMMEWVRSRSGQSPRPLGAGYDESERAYPDKFIDPYVGRVSFGDTASEVVSMGIQHFVSPFQMTDLFMEDPEHFYLALGFLMNAKRRASKAPGEKV